MKDIGFDADKPKSGTKSKVPKKRMKQIKQYVDEIDDNTKQFARELNKLPTSEDNQDSSFIFTENSSFIFTVCVRSVPPYHFKLAFVILQMAVKEFFEIHF